MIDMARRVCAMAPAMPSQEACRWTWYTEVDGEERKKLFLARARARGAAHQSEMVTLLAPGQLGDAAFRSFPNRMSLGSWMRSLSQADTCFTRVGYCDR